MVIVDDAMIERFMAKLAQVKAAQRTARAHIKDLDAREFNAAMNEAEQGMRDLERMVA
jgi:uncharacterized protein YlbG (UPF0298 family)